MAQVTLENVSHHYTTEQALQDVTLAFVDDVTTAVVGPRGSGKSTLLQLINGLVRPSQGKVLVCSGAIEYEGLGELGRKIGYAVQGTGLFPHLTVEANITLLARLVGWDRDRIRARAETLMTLVNLPFSYARRY